MPQPPTRCPVHPNGHGPGQEHDGFHTRVVSETGRLESEQIVSGSDVSYTLAAGAEGHIKTINKIKKRVQAMAEGKEDPAKLRRDLERYYMQRMTSRSFGGQTPQAKGAKYIDVLWAQGPGQFYRMVWEWRPNSIGGPSMVMGICPKCLIRAPSQVDVGERTKPVLVEGRLGWARGNPEADAKEVTFRLVHPIFHMRLDPQDRLTVREIVRCTSGRHGPEEKLVGERCDWAVRVEDGIASSVSSKILKPHAAAPSGQIVIP
jgi:hypothetical protein